MLFTSPIFLVLLAITFVIYYIPFLSKLQVQILIISSLIFYAYNEPGLLALLLFSAFINVTVSYAVVHGNPGRRKLYATLGIIINLLLLIFFKYSPLFAKTFLNVDAGVGAFLIMVPLPIGISFYTFEGISLLIDVYSNKHSDILTVEKPIKKHIYKTLFFISFFPHLIAGPILKAYEFYPQIGPKKFNQINWTSVFKNLVTGYFLKMVVADNLTNFTLFMQYPYFKTYSSIDLIIMIFGYSCQIFADFAGYSLIAIGLAGLFGYNLMTNFNFPYISSSFSEFWRRWHISLSTFLKEYLYIPLGGNRKGNFRTYLNLIITMGLGGLWHGAAWSYAIWGLFHGLALALERLFVGSTPKKRNYVSQTLRMIMVFSFVSLAWVLFKLPIGDVSSYFTAIFTNYKMSANWSTIALIMLYACPVILYHFAHLSIPKLKPEYHRAFEKYQFIYYGVLIFFIIVNSGPSGSFIYFQF